MEVKVSQRLNERVRIIGNLAYLWIKDLFTDAEDGMIFPLMSCGF